MLGRKQCRGMKDALILAGQCSTRPGVPANMKRILMSLCFIFIFEAVVTKIACVLFLSFMGSR